jgi:hypothetical protein
VKAEPIENRAGAYFRPNGERYVAPQDALWVVYGDGEATVYEPGDERLLPQREPAEPEPTLDEKVERIERAIRNAQTILDVQEELAKPIEREAEAIEISR